MLEEVLPEELVIAVLHRVGSGIKFRENKTLDRCFGDAAEESPDIFGDFCLHPQYGDCPKLRDALQVLSLGGAVVSEGQDYVCRASEGVLGDYGKTKYNALPDEAKAAVDEVAEAIRQAFPPK